MSELPLIRHRVLPGPQAKQVKGDLARLRDAVAGAKTLAPGADGPAVVALQRLLRGVNLYAGEATGKYDAATEAAVRKLEAKLGVASADGVVDAAELKGLKAQQLFVKDGFQTHAKVGQKGTDIKAMEHRLKMLGFDPGKVDGVYDAQLERAVKAFRKSEKGIPDRFEGIGPKVAQGLRHEVKSLEADLKALGRDVGKVDGRYTEKTRAAVKAFQKKHDLAPTGIADAKTRAAIEKAANQGASGKTQKFIDVALAQRGDPYVFGAEGPNAFDCSGLIYYALKQAGVNVPRLTAAGYQNLYKDSKVSRENLKPGDLVFLWYPNDRGIPPGQASHIEIYLGNGKTMGTDNPSEGARVEPMDWSAFIGGARVPGLK